MHLHSEDPSCARLLQIVRSSSSCWSSRRASIDLAELLCANVKAFAAPRSRQLESHYFDTADRRLRARGASLRVRRTGDSFVQTVKTRSEDSGAHSVRGEWECPVAGLVPELDAVADPAALDRLGMVLPEELEQVFVTEVERRLVLVEQAVPGAGSSIIEVAFDRGDVVADGMGTARPDGKAPERARRKRAASRSPRSSWSSRPARPAASICCSPRCAPGHPCRSPSPTRPSVAIGWLMAARRRRAGRPGRRSSPTMTVSDALGAILRNCLGQWLRNIAAARDGRDIEGVHQLRDRRPALPLGAVAVHRRHRSRRAGGVERTAQSGHCGHRAGARARCVSDRDTAGGRARSGERGHDGTGRARPARRDRAARRLRRGARVPGRARPCRPGARSGQLGRPRAMAGGSTAGQPARFSRARSSTSPGACSRSATSRCASWAGISAG